MLEKEKQDLEASCLKVLGFWKLLLLKRSSFPHWITNLTSKVLME